MALSLKHAFNSAKGDGTDPTQVQPSNWNAEHTITVGANKVLGGVGAGAVSEIDCTAAGRALIAGADVAAQRTTLGLGALAVKSTVLTADIVDANVTTAKIADANITTVKIADANVTSAKTAFTAPTVPALTSDNAPHTYTPSAGVLRVRVRMCGGGGCGGYTGTGNGAPGNTTTFGSWTALGGSAAINGAGSRLGGAGGTGGATGTGTLIMRRDGGAGQAGASANGGMGGQGGSNPFGGGGSGGSGSVGIAGAAGTGGGGGGAQNGGFGGGGGGAGEYVEFWVNGPGATSYTIGSGGAAGGTGTAGGNGATGGMSIEEFYW